MALPYPTKVVLPFDIATAQDMNERHANDEALANGSGLDNGAVTSDKIGIVWQTWNNPISSGITIGNGTVTAKYFTVAKKVTFYFQFTLGSTSAITGDVLLTPPVAFASSFASGRQPLGNVSLVDAGTNVRAGEAHILHTSPFDKIRISHYSVSGSVVGISSLSATLPFTWANGDSILAIGEYESV
jgi:hypothetical protein